MKTIARQVLAAGDKPILQIGGALDHGPCGQTFVCGDHPQSA